MTDTNRLTLSKMVKHVLLLDSVIIRADSKPSNQLQIEKIVVLVESTGSGQQSDGASNFGRSVRLSNVSDPSLPTMFAVEVGCTDSDARLADACTSRSLEIHG